MKQHDILEDRAGWGEHLRLTCLIDGATLVKQPYMTLEQWQKLVDDFKAKHSEASKEKAT